MILIINVFYVQSGRVFNLNFLGQTVLYIFGIAFFFNLFSDEDICQVVEKACVSLSKK